MTGTHNPINSGLCFVVFGWDHFQKSLRCVTAGCDSCQRLPYLMCDRGNNHLGIHKFIIPFTFENGVRASEMGRAVPPLRKQRSKDICAECQTRMLAWAPRT